MKPALSLLDLHHLPSRSLRSSFSAVEAFQTVMFGQTSLRRAAQREPESLLRRKECLKLEPCYRKWGNDASFPLATFYSNQHLYQLGFLYLVG